MHIQLRLKVELQINARLFSVSLLEFHTDHWLGGASPDTWADLPRHPYRCYLA